ncbi:MAG: hypothetical protein AVDCRST_MAG58-2804, partial [uncultured Rubrobacteraceae bacterium]
EPHASSDPAFRPAGDRPASRGRCRRSRLSPDEGGIRSPGLGGFAFHGFTAHSRGARLRAEQGGKGRPWSGRARDFWGPKTGSEWCI